MKTILFSLLIISYCSNAIGQKSAYVIYNSKGKKVSYEKMLKEISTKDIILFGELHNNPISHWIELELTKDLSRLNELILGAEMIEADNQKILTDYLNSSITEIELDSLCRLWPNYNTDYAPIVNFAKKQQIPFVATNIPRHFAKMVHKNGFPALDSLSINEKNWIAPLPILFDSSLATYQNILEMMGEHGTPNLVKAQAIKDATMAYFILKNYSQGKQFLHFNGAYHSDFYEGILWYINSINSKYTTCTISTVSQSDINKLDSENKSRADFIICVDEDMTPTY